MPLYEYECPTCGHRQTEFRQVAQRHDAPTCHGRAMSIVISPSQVVADTPGYVSPTTGKWIEGRAARRADLKASGARPWEGFAAEKAEADWRKADAERIADRKLDAAVRESWNALSPAKRRQLEGDA
jgi:putative FmdB family regulatory protein